MKQRLEFLLSTLRWAWATAQSAVLRASKRWNVTWARPDIPLETLKAHGRRNRISAAFTASICFHALLLYGLLFAGLSRQMGIRSSIDGGADPNAMTGAPVTATIVSLSKMLVQQPSSSGASAVAKEANQPVLAPAQSSNQNLSPKNLLADAPSGTPANSEVGRIIPSEAVKAEKTASEALPAGQANKPIHDTAGVPDGTRLLQQIARCLPPGSRPALKAAKLTLRLDKNGQLSVPPKVQFVAPSFVSKDDMADADRIVQAALQCGPYQLDQPVEDGVDLLADFSFLDGPNRPVEPHKFLK